MQSSYLLTLILDFETLAFLVCDFDTTFKNLELQITKSHIFF